MTSWRPAQIEICDLLQSFEPEDMKMMFGDHQKITVQCSGKIIKEDHEHN